MRKPGQHEGILGEDECQSAPITDYQCGLTIIRVVFFCPIFVRRMAGVPRHKVYDCGTPWLTECPEMTDTALLIIDAQESFRQRASWAEVDSPTYLRNQQALIDGAIENGWKIVRVFHAEPEGIFSPASGFVRPLAELKLDKPDLEFFKFRHSAFVGSPLEVYLIENGIRRLVISGIRTEQCCETTTRHGSDLGWQVDYVTEATHTMPLTDAAGKTWTAEEIKARTAAVLDGRFARVCTIAEALAGGETMAAAA